MSSNYDVQFFDGDYRARQQKANQWGADLYLEQHFNSSHNHGVNFPLAIVGRNASRVSKALAAQYVQMCYQALPTLYTREPPGTGVLIGGYQGRGNGNVYYANCPSVLLEPMFISNMQAAQFIVTAEGQQQLANITAMFIRLALPDGGKVALSIGHKGKTSNPHDRGAQSVLGDMEADLAEQVLILVKGLLDG